MDASPARGYLESMILLSEAAEKIRRELRSWPQGRKTDLRIRCIPPIADARSGDERRLVEFLGIIVGKLSIGLDRINIDVSGDDDLVEFTIRNVGDTETAAFLPDLGELTGKAACWTPTMEMVDSAFRIVLRLPAVDGDTPLDLPTMAGETGLKPEEVMGIVSGFIADGRSRLNNLAAPDTDPRERYRAAHSLKGAGRTMRAPELAAAAGALEQRIGEGLEDEEEFRRLKEAWNGIERWYERYRP